MFLSLFSNPIQSIARIGLTYLVRNFSLPTITISLITTVYQIARTSIQTIGVIPTMNSLFIIRRFIMNNSDLNFNNLRYIFNNSSTLSISSLLEAFTPFWSLCIKPSSKWVFLKLFNLFIFTMFFTCLKNIIFKLIKICISSVITILTGFIFFDIPYVDSIKEFINPVIIDSKPNLKILAIEVLVSCVTSIIIYHNKALIIDLWQIIFSSSLYIWKLHSSQYLGPCWVSLKPIHYYLLGKV